MSDKRIFYITANRLTVYWSTGRHLHKDVSFSVEEDGYDLFGEYLQTYPDVPSDVLIDIIEEEFRVDTMPHVYGRDRSALLERKSKKLFHQTAYRCAEVQEREQTGRRDDNILLTALTNPEQLKRWLSIMLDHKIPVVGTYSMPALAPCFLKKLSINSAHTLVFVPEQDGMIRQTFLNRFSVKISRLLPITENEYKNYSDFLTKETQKNQRYLLRLRLLSPANIIEVYVVCEQSAVENLQESCPNSETIHYHFITINEVMNKLNLQSDVKPNHCEDFFIHLLPKNRSKLNYCSKDERRYHFMHETRKVLITTSFVLTIGFIALAGQTFLNGLDLKQKSIDLKQQTNIISDKYHILVNNLPKTDISPRNMQNAVQIVDALTKHKTNPQLMMTALSQGLANFPNIQINGIQWLSSDQPNIPNDSINDAQDQEIQTGTSIQNRFQIATINGRLKSFNGNYQTAFRILDKFVQTLKTDSRFIEVTATKYPLNIDSNSTLSMSSGKSTEYRAAEFEIRAVIKVHNEKV